jgi:hypothetical protein
MERERDTTEQEESLLDNDKQPWLSDIVLPHNDDEGEMERERPRLFIII